MEPQDFFFQLLEKTKKAFYESPISKKQEKDWGASVCDTTIKKNKPILAGINWGGNEDKGFQTAYPKDRDLNYTFSKNASNLLKEYFNIENIKDINYCNVCFFRTPNEKMLVTKDWENSIPLFEEYVKYINPEYVIILGRTPIVMLDRFDKLNEIKRERYGDKKKFRVYKALLFGKYKLYGLPHPNAHIKKETLLEIWSSIKK